MPLIQIYLGDQLNRDIRKYMIDHNYKKKSKAIIDILEKAI